MTVPNNKTHISRYSYGSGSGTYSVGMDPRNFLTRNMNPYTEYITVELHEVLSSNKDRFNLGAVDMSNNSITALCLFIMPENT